MGLMLCYAVAIGLRNRDAARRSGNIAEAIRAHEHAFADPLLHSEENTLCQG